MTPRLKELEEVQHTSRSHFGTAEGYRMALEDVEPVLQKAQKVIDECSFCQAALNGTGGCFGTHKPLRDALAAFKGE